VNILLSNKRLKNKINVAFNRLEYYCLNYCIYLRLTVRPRYLFVFGDRTPVDICIIHNGNRSNTGNVAIPNGRLLLRSSAVKIILFRAVY